MSGLWLALLVVALVASFAIISYKLALAPDEFDEEPPDGPAD